MLLKPQPFLAVVLAVSVQALQKGLELGEKRNERCP